MKKMIEVTLFYLALCSLTFASDFRFVPIDLPHASATRAFGINARGDIVGRYDDNKGTHGFLLHNGVFSKIDFLDGSFTIAQAINARGDIVGRALDASGKEHGFLRRDNRFIQIDYPGSSTTAARGINNAGDITGNYSITGDDEEGFILQDGKFRKVIVPNSGTTDVWMAMDNGTVFVGDIYTDADGGIHGYVRDKQGNFHIINFPGAGAPCTALRWINEREEIGGVYANTLDECYAFQAHGFLLRKGVYTAFDFPGSAYSEVHAINDDGEIVGLYTDMHGNVHGFKAVPESR